MNFGEGTVEKNRYSKLQENDKDWKKVICKIKTRLYL